MNQLKIGNRIIGDGCPTYIIAEIGINHNGDIALAKNMIEKAKECGVDCVKFQKRHLPSIYKAEVLNNPHLFSIGLGVYIPILKEVEFTIKQHWELKEYCKEFGLDYLCSPFDIVSAEELNQLGVDAYKIGSINMKNYGLIDKVIEFNKPLLISTGMCRSDDITALHVHMRSKQKEDFMYLHCVSTYPVDFKDVNLSMLERLENLQSPVGYSGHERGIEISVCAVAMGASVIERHFTLDRTMKGPDHAASLEPEGLKRMCEHIRCFELAKGDGLKRITRGEQIVRESLGREAVCIGD